MQMKKTQIKIKINKSISHRGAFVIYTLTQMCLILTIFVKKHIDNEIDL